MMPTCARVPRRGARPPAGELRAPLGVRRTPATRAAGRAADVLRAGASSAFAEPCVYANFVETLDGVVSIPELERSNALVADESEDDRSSSWAVCAFADVVLIGSGTLLASAKARRAGAGGRWPAGAEAAEVRLRLGKPEDPSGRGCDGRVRRSTMTHRWLAGCGRASQQCARGSSRVSFLTSSASPTVSWVDLREASPRAAA